MAAFMRNRSKAEWRELDALLSPARPDPAPGQFTTQNLVIRALLTDA